MTMLNLTPNRLALLRAIEANTVRGMAHPVSGDWWTRPGYKRVHGRERRALTDAGLVEPGPRDGDERSIVLTEAGRQALADLTAENAAGEEGAR